MPLAQESVTFDVKTGSKGFLPNDPDGCPLLAVDSKYYSSSFLYDASPTSITEFRIYSGESGGSPNLYPKFTFAFTIRPSEVDTVLFEYVADNENSRQQAITRVKAELVPKPDEEEKGTVKVTLGNPEGKIVAKTSSHYKLEKNKEWRTVMITVSVEKEEMNIIVENEEYRDSFNISGLQGLAVIQRYVCSLFGWLLAWLVNGWVGWLVGRLPGWL